MPLEYENRTNHLDAQLGFSLLRLTLGLDFAFPLTTGGAPLVRLLRVRCKRSLIRRCLRGA